MDILPVCLRKSTKIFLKSKHLKQIQCKNHILLSQTCDYTLWKTKRDRTEFCLFCVGVTGFEPVTPCSQSRCANRTALHPVSFLRCKGNAFFLYSQDFRKKKHIKLHFFAI